MGIFICMYKKDPISVFAVNIQSPIRLENININGIKEKGGELNC